jgi:radical SAM superfamily enzyme YgiQ (UPF0313 family)/MoaA/NifB/PqqE/SkfB family radical SAM enzyme
VQIPAEKWLDAWDKIYSKYGSVDIDLIGGEPCIYPGFVDLLVSLSKKHYLGITTNLSGDFHRFAENLSPEKFEVGIGASFHPAFTDIDTFLGKARFLKEKGFKVWVNYVAYPPQMPQMKSIKEVVSGYGIPFVVQPFRGQYLGRQYPEHYTLEEKEVIRELAGTDVNIIRDMEFQLERKSTYGRLCRAGQLMAHIGPNGDVKRCGEAVGKIGNILDSDFSLLKGPESCLAAHCPCDHVYLVEADSEEYKFTLVSQENELVEDLLEDAGHCLYNLRLPRLAEELARKSLDYKKDNPAALDILRVASSLKADYLTLSQQPAAPKKIALVLAPAWGVDSPSYALALLAAVLRNSGLAANVFDINNMIYRTYKDDDKHRQLWDWEQSSFWLNSKLVSQYIGNNSELLDRMVEAVLANSPDVVGFTVYMTTKYMSLEMACRIKKKRKDVIIVFGGSECQRKTNWKELIEQECVDAVILDDADSSFPEFVSLIGSGGTFKSCPGVVYKSAGEIIDCGDREPIKLDELPFADFSDFDFKAYKCANHIKLAFSRGCTEQCAYCSARCVWRGFRTMSAERIFREIKFQVEQYRGRFGYDDVIYIMFLDSLVNGNMQVFKEWIAMLAQECGNNSGLFSRFSWGAQVIIRKEMTLEIAQLAKNSGCVELNYGIESGSAKVLKEMRKRYTPEIAQNVIFDINRAGIPTKANFMFGFPTETEDDFLQTLDFIRRNGRFITQIYPSRTFCAIERFSYLDENKEKFSIAADTCGNYLFWESQEGRNNYLVRLDRYSRFCKEVIKINPQALETGVSDIERDNCLCLGQYYQYCGDFRMAIESYSKYLKYKGVDVSVYEEIEKCKKALDGLGMPV